MKRHLVLTGFMGSGKTTIGRCLSKTTGLDFVDSDEEVLLQTGLHPVRYIRRFGLSSFRKIEKRVVHSILTGPPVILSTGGGSILDHRNRALMLQSGFVVWLKAPLWVLMGRIRRRSGLPSYIRPRSVRDLQALVEKREPYYRLAHLKVMNAFDPPEKVANEIVRKYKKKNAPGPFE
ncbi:MAG: shikimate kinase [Deltaproteobacteria bacterium]|nr:shikimate kinase [Deltaproteobacteria bacterium]